MQLLLALLVCAAAGTLPAARAGEPPHSDTESLLLNVHDLGTTAAPDDATPPPTNAPATADGTATGGREGGSDVELVKAETEDASTSTTTSTAATPTTTATTTGTTTTATTSTTISSSTTTTTTASVADQPSGDVADLPADSSGVTVAAAVGADDGDSTTAAPDASPDAAIPKTVADDAEDGQEMTINGAPIVAADAPSTTTTTTTAAATSAAVADVTTSTTELPVRLVSGVALPPNQPTLSRHRADPGLAPSETKPSKARTGVLDPEILDNPSKPRKGAPPSADTPQPQPTPSFFGGLSVTEGTPVTGSVTPQTSSDAGGGTGFFGGFFGSNTPGSSTTAQSPGAGEQDVPQTTEAQSDAQTEPTTEEPALKHKPAEARDDSESAPGSSSDVRGSVVAGAVVLVILVLIIGFFVVRRLRETWYRRHYRKMDFLVDGMYNL